MITTIVKSEEKRNTFDEEYVRDKTPKPPSLLYYRGFSFVSFLLHPKRLINYLKFRASKFNSKVNYTPIVMDIEPTRRCNYKCLMCYIHPQEREDMTFEEFKLVIDDQPGLMEVKIQGVGEPLLNKDFFKMAAYCKKKMLWVRTTTNGSLLHLNDNYKKLIDANFHDINISIDGASKETYETIRKGGGYDRIKQNCCLLNSYNKGNKTTVRAWVVLQKKNKHEFFDFPEFFASLGFKNMCISFAMHNYGREKANSEATQFDFTKEDFDRYFDICNRVRIKSTFWFHQKADKDNFCKIPFQRIYLTSESRILPCCTIANAEVVNFGTYDEFQEIWYNKYVKFREALKSGDVPAYCKNCYIGGK